MNEDLSTEGEKYEIREKKDYLTISVLGVLVVVAIVIYWRFGMSDTISNNFEAVPQSSVADVVSDLPKAVAVEPEAKSTSIVEDFGLAEVSTTFVSPRSVADAVAYYTAAIVEKGGTIEITMRTPEKEIIVAKTADGKPYVVYIGEKDGQTVVTINVDPVQ